MWSVWMRDSAILSYCDFENFSVFIIVRCVYLKKSWILKKQNSNDDCKIFNKQNTKKLRKKNKKERNRVDDNNNTTIMCFTLYPPPPTPDKKSVTYAGSIHTSDYSWPWPRSRTAPHSLCPCTGSSHDQVHRNKLWEQNQSTENTSYHIKSCEQSYQTLWKRESCIMPSRNFLFAVSFCSPED